MESVILDENLVIIGLQCKEKEEALELLSEKLKKRGYITDDFLMHLLEREASYPTGLPASVPLALCHTEAEYVKQSAMAVATLKTPVAFQEMGNPDGTVEAQMIFLLALHNPKDQVLWLKRMANLFKNHEALLAIRNAAVPADVVAVLQKNVFGEPE